MDGAEKRFYTIRETMRLTGLSEGFLRSGVKSGRVPHVMSGNRALINVPLLLTQLDAVSLGDLHAGGEVLS